jgi:plastocyanin
VVVAGLSTGHLVALVVVAAVFISFSLAASFLAPRYRPDFPGKGGIGVFVIACFALFAAMIGAVAVFGREAPEASAAETARPAHVVQVKEKEFKILLATKTLKPGRTTFVVDDVGKIQHDLAVSGPGVKEKKTPLVAPGKKASVTVTLKKGTYTLWCTVPGHRQLGMVVKVHVT